MKNCKLTIEVVDDRILSHAEHMSLVELATLSGYLQTLAGFEAYKRGRDIEDIKDSMLDIHFEAMAGLVQDIKRSETKQEE